MDRQILLCGQKAMAGMGKKRMLWENMYWQGFLNAKLQDSQEEIFAQVLSWQGCVVGYSKHIFSHWQVFLLYTSVKFQLVH